MKIIGTCAALFVLLSQPVYASEQKKAMHPVYQTTDLAKESTLEIAEVKKGSVLEKLGLQKGDIIMSINGKPVNGPNDLLAMNTVFTAAKPLTVIFARDGKTQALKVNPGK